MDPAKYEFQSAFAKRYVARGRAQGRAEGVAAGRVEVLMKQLRRRFGEVSGEAEERLRGASSQELELFAERVLTAGSLEEFLGK